MIRSGDVDPAFAIFARFQQRNRERIKFAIAQLDKEPDWTLNETFEFDREKAPWAASHAELDEFWRKRVKNDALSLLLTGKSWDEAAKLLKKRYETTLKRIDQVSADDVFESLMNSYARAYDPHSSYFSPRSSEEYRIQMSLNYDGIGASLQLVDDYVTIMNVIEGGPAAVAGTLSVKDRITGVGQGKEGPVTDVLGWRIDDVVQLIRGRAGTQVRLQVLPAGAAPGTPEKTLEFTRNKVTLEAQAAQKELRTIKRGDKEIRVGIINVPAFYQDVEAQNAGDKEYRSHHARRAPPHQRTQGREDRRPEFIDEPAHVTRGAAKFLVTGVLGFHVLVERRYVDDADPIFLVATLDGTQLFLRRLGLERVGGEFQRFLRRAGSGARGQHLQAHLRAGAAAQHVVDAPAEHVGDRAFLALAHTGDAIL